MVGVKFYAAISLPVRRVFGEVFDLGTSEVFKLLQRWSKKIRQLKQHRDPHCRAPHFRGLTSGEG